MQALDIVLLLPEKVHQEMIILNQSLDHTNRVIDFQRDKSHPHISLCMLIADEKEVEIIIKKIDDIVGQHKPITIRNEHIYIYEIQPLRSTFAGIKNRKTPELYNLHKNLIDTFQVFAGRESDVDMFEKPEQVDTISCTRVNNYFENASYENFSPHITLGAGTPQAQIQTKEFITPKLALCHLGNYCTARTIIKEREL